MGNIGQVRRNKLSCQKLHMEEERKNIKYGRNFKRQWNR